MPISYAEAIRGEFAPFKVGDAWGPPWSTTWFRIRGGAPHVGKDRQVIVCFVLQQAELTVHESAAPEVRETRLDPSHHITAVGHAHIDTAWESPIPEAKRKVARSWSTQLALMDEHPDYVFAASQPAQYAWMKKLYPDIYRRIKEKCANRLPLA